MGVTFVIGNGGLREVMASKIAILIIDDEPSVADALGMILGECGYEVIVAATGMGGLEQADRKRFDVTITDLRLPDISGLEVLRRIREKDPAVGVIVITAYSTQEAIAELLEQGAIQVLSKPFGPADICNSVNLALSRRKETSGEQECSVADND